MTLSHAYDVPAADAKTIAMVAAANLFLHSLDEDQRKAAAYPFTDNAQRSNWSNFPEGMVPRGGIKLGTLSALQRQRLDGLLDELLSKDGFRNVVLKLAAEDTLVSEDPLGVMLKSRTPTLDGGGRKASSVLRTSASPAHRWSWNTRLRTATARWITPTACIVK